MAIAARSIDERLAPATCLANLHFSSDRSRAAFPSRTQCFTMFMRRAEDAIDRAKAEPCSDAPLVGRCHGESFLVNVPCAEEVMRASRRAEAQARP